jgi:hypothetical protein
VTTLIRKEVGLLEKTEFVRVSELAKSPVDKEEHRRKWNKSLGEKTHGKIIVKFYWVLMSLQESVNNLLLSKIGEESESNIKKIEAVVRTLVSDDVPIDNIFSTDLITQDGIEPTIKTLHVESIEAKLRR